MILSDIIQAKYAGVAHVKGRHVHQTVKLGHSISFRVKGCQQKGSSKVSDKLDASVCHTGVNWCSPWCQGDDTLIVTLFDRCFTFSQ